MREVRSRWPGVVAVGALVYVTVLAINRSLVEVRGPSMEPSLWEGDRLLTVPARRSWLEPGQVVVVTDPAHEDHEVVKRLTSVEGGKVTVHGDNPRASTDSSVWGPLPLAAVRRIAVARWPDLRTSLRRLP